MLWVDKHRPKALEKLDYHDNLSKRLKAIAGTGDLPHLLFYGPSGAGKKTRVMALLREMFGPGVEKVKLEHRTFKTPSRRTIELTTLGSNYHIEMNPSDAGNNDRYVVQEVIKEIAQFHPVVSGMAEGAGKGKNVTFKVVFLSDCDRLTKAAQHGLRRTMEKYVKSCRLILCCENLSKVIDPLRSRCLPIRVSAPSREEICSILMTVSEKERAPLSQEAAARITDASKRNLRRALLMAEAQRVRNDPNAEVPVPDWESFIAGIVSKIEREQSPKMLLEVRKDLYHVLGNCIPPSVVFQTLVYYLVKRMDASLAHDVFSAAADYEHRMHLGQKDVYHIEAFVAQVMLLYKKYIADLVNLC
ncbi:Replication factor C subunit 3 (Activator 1 38 kDa subunit) (A1 38 kDa subunit) (Activator 1 subunit 3) (Replication factor C 38 kDa subunit) (RF-C 38 kDa subunit) (RFC38) [Durusdinium trenchii]|uniref:Replication factor C subunit 3 (Activator 1 38 kDa subunit) (A1 38 kDa subunit) (Activator 1 subunit 3) (Replication factor C 38 kDa subunit) (RF-C 38 kDa subunit) (RFC38) n=1 Tax=Durusdinium trenchii TaxID=1381693 RepID=A0ABP0MEC7_9DINO